MYEVIVADDVLAAQADPVSDPPGVVVGWRGPVLFLVEPHPSSRDGLADVASASAAAADRFHLVDASGIELAGGWMTAERPTADAMPPRLGDGGVVVGAFAKDEITLAQGATLVRVLLAELHARKLGARVSCPPPDLAIDDLPMAPAPARPRAGRTATAPAPPDRWYVQRGVRATTTTGHPYVDLDWLQPDGTWSRNQDTARSFENSRDSVMEMGALVTRLREQASAADDGGYGEVNGVLLAPGEGDPGFERPPASIRDHGHTWRSPVASP